MLEKVVISYYSYVKCLEEIMLPIFHYLICEDIKIVAVKDFDL